MNQEIKEIKLGGYNCKGSDFDCTDGELLAAKNLVWIGGRLCSPPKPTEIARLEPGHKLVLEHDVPEGKNWIVTCTNGAATSIKWLPKPSLPGTQMSLACSLVADVFGEIKAIAASGSLVIVSTESGLQYMDWNGSAYDWLGHGPEMPVIEFGLQKAGHLDISGSFELPASMVPSNSTNNNGSLKHPSTQAQKAAAQAATAAVNEAMQQAVRRQVESRGFFYQPFFVRYALRMHDGSHILPSAPMLMLAPQLPPCLQLQSTLEIDGDDSTRLANFSGIAIPYFQLRQKITKGLSEKWLSRIASIDIFASPQSLTYNPDSPSSYGIVGYGRLADASNAGGADRGRPNGSRADEEPESVLVGIWSDGDDNYQTHTLQDLGLASLPAWDFEPNSALLHDLRNVSDFYLISSIPASVALECAAFSPVEVASTHADALKKSQKLQASSQSLFKISPSCMHSLHGRLLMGGGTKILPQPALAPAMPATSDLLPTSISVVSGYGVSRRIASVQCSVADLSHKFPHFLFYPDPNAVEMKIIQEEKIWKVPLTRHNGLEGASWMSTLAPNPGKSLETNDYEDDANVSDKIEQPNLLLATKESNPFVLDKSVAIGNGRIIAIIGALRAMSQEQFGQFPLYVFSTDGIWALSGQDFSIKGQISAESPLSAQAIVTTVHGPVYASRQGLTLIEGAKCKRLFDAASQLSQHLPELPKLDLIYENTTNNEAALPPETLLYWHSLDMLLAARDGRAFAYSFSEEKWGEMACLYTSAFSPYGLQNNGIVVDLSQASALPESSLNSSALITRPMKLGHPAGPRQVRSAELLGTLDPSRTAFILYGSNDMKHWEITATSSISCRFPICGSPWRYFILAARAVLYGNDHIAAAQLRA